MPYALESICLFNSLDEKQLETLRNISTITKFKEGNILFYEGDSPKYLYFLLEGLVKICRSDNLDSITVLDYCYTQTLIGEAASLQQTTHQITAECDTDSVLLVVEYESFSKHFLHNPDIALQFIMQLIKKVKSLMKNRVPQTSVQKIAELIYENIELFKKLKKYKIAAILNMAPETFSRNLKSLKKEGIIDYGGGYFKVIDEATLFSKFNSCKNTD
ncbi:MAG: Crp/Fnr family transcriptional regulator [Campylobacteraceae bacterium]|nr:Crp/Fnr family transcriptional regulator [Campylobacteraceae bacterium]